MIVLDTDHVSELQYPNSVRGARLLERLNAVEGRPAATTIVSFEEQMRGWLAAINNRPAGISQVEAYTNLVEVERFYRKWLILPYGATLLSANLRDFRQVPGISVEDWLASE
jgi:tRNA(fMet)-specific endonuclease VapC